MELYVMAGGHNDSLKRWENDLSAQFLPMYKDGKPLEEEGKKMYRRLLIAPVQLYKIAFAKEELDRVLSMVCPTEYVEERYSTIKKLIKLFRRIMGLKQVPPPSFQNPLLQPNQIDKAVFVIPVGLKDDAYDANGNELI